MIAIDARDADTAWRIAFRAIAEKGSVQLGRDQATREVLNVALSIAEPRQRLVYAVPFNPAFAIVEVLWILAGRDDLGTLQAWNPRMKRWSDDGQTFHGAYGKRLRRHFGIDQLTRAANVLRQENETRQVVLQIWDPATDLPVSGPRSKDVPCNIAGHLLIRRNRLEWTQFMRSNDLVWGTPHNLVQFTTLQEILAGWVEVGVGSYNHYASTLHVYERHWDFLDAPATPAPRIPTNHADLRLGYDEWEKCWSLLLQTADACANAKSTQALERAAGLGESLPTSYREWCHVLAAEAARRKGMKLEAYGFIQSAGDFWGTSWKLWNSSREYARQAGMPPEAVVLPPDAMDLLEDCAGRSKPEGLLTGARMN